MENKKEKINNLYLYICTVISKGTYKTSSIPIVNTDGQSVVVLPWNGVFRSIFPFRPQKKNLEGNCTSMKGDKKQKTLGLFAATH